MRPGRALGPPPGGAVSRRGGFTMIELILVLLLTGIMSAVAVGVISDAEDNTLPYELTTLKTHIRYIQARAMGLNAEFGLRYQDGAYWMFSGANLAERKTLPGQNADSVPLTCGVAPAPFTLAFDGRGRPYDSTVLTDLNLLRAPLAVTLTHGGESRSLRVIQGTGYIP